VSQEIDQFDINMRNTGHLTIGVAYQDVHLQEIELCFQFDGYAGRANAYINLDELDSIAESLRAWIEDCEQPVGDRAERTILDLGKGSVIPNGKIRLNAIPFESLSRLLLRLEIEKTDTKEGKGQLHFQIIIGLPSEGAAVEEFILDLNALQCFKNRVGKYARLLIRTD